MKGKFSIAALFEDNRFLKVFSVVTAILLYIVVAMITNDTIELPITNVPVNLNAQASSLANQRLNIIEGQDYTVDITVRGPRTVVGRLSADSPELATTARVADLDTAGKHTLPIVSAYTGAKEFEIVSYSPREVTVTLDRFKSKTFDVLPLANGVSCPPGYVTEPETASPSKVTVTGPEADVNKIASAEISVELTEPLAEPYAVSRPIVLRDEEGQELDPEALHLTLDVTESQISIPVYKETTLPLEVKFLNLPRGFPVEELRGDMRLTVDSIRVYGPESVVDSLTEISLGHIDIKELSPEKSTFSFPLNLSDTSAQLKSTGNIAGVDIYFDTYDWTTQRFNVKDIEAVNVPANFEVRLASTTLNNVEFVGVGGALDTMTADDIVGEVDLSDRELKPGQYPMQVKLSAPTKGLVWALGSDHTVIVEIAEKK